MVGYDGFAEPFSADVTIADVKCIKNTVNKECTDLSFCN